MIALVIATITAAQAQSWCPPGARWLFDTGNPWQVAQTEVTYVGDTIVDGFVSQKLERHYKLVQSFGNDTLIEGYHTPWITRVEGDMVLDKVEGVWDTLFHFGAVPGDSWQSNWLDGLECPDHTLHVVDTATVLIDGVALRQLDLDIYFEGVPIGWGGVAITERIGGAFWLGPPPCGVYECYCTMICYQDNQVSTWLDPCTFTVGIEDVQVGEHAPLRITQLGSEVMITIRVR